MDSEFNVIGDINHGPEAGEIANQRMQQMKKAQMQAMAAAEPPPPPPPPPPYINKGFLFNNNFENVAKIAADWCSEQLIKNIVKRKKECSTDSELFYYKNLHHHLVDLKFIKRFTDTLEELILKILQKNKTVLLASGYKDDLIKKAAEINKIPADLVLEKNTAVLITKNRVSVFENVFEGKSCKTLYGAPPENGMN